MGEQVTSTLAFQILDWLGASFGESSERETLASLKITAGREDFPLTEVEDTLAHTVRSHINVPAYSLAHWLLVNWWRLRWEPFREKPSFDWLLAHSMAAIGGDNAWPALQFGSDGEFVQLRLKAEAAPDASALRYLRDIVIDVPAEQFELAVDSFLDQVEARVSARLPKERELTQLRAEVSQERHDAKLAAASRLQALAGIDVGAASPDWMKAAEELAAIAGARAAEEVLAVVPELRGGLDAANAAISAMQSSTATVRVDWAAGNRFAAPNRGKPWERGAQLAAAVRAKHGLPRGPLSNDTMEQLLGTKLPLDRSSWTGERALGGGYRNGHDRTHLLVTSRRLDNQRFFLARVIAAAAASADDQHVLAVSNAGTALQKLERSFAQEFLCPWADLDAFTDEHGTDDEAIEDAAEHFVVSEQVIRLTLVDKGKCGRSAR